MSLPPRFITVLSLLQFFFVIGGYLFVRGILRARELSGGQDRPGPPHAPGISGFILIFGPYLLLVPAIWFFLHVLLKSRDRDAVNLPSAIAGIAITIALAVIFTLGGIHAFLMLFG